MKEEIMTTILSPDYHDHHPDHYDHHPDYHDHHPDNDPHHHELIEVDAPALVLVGDMKTDLARSVNQVITGTMYQVPGTYR